MKTRWYKDAVVYQIYPRSFLDSNGDGVGDLNGILQKADYLKGLGIDAVWLSPCYKSPNDDNGYDISDYRDIMDEFGTLADWEKMLEAFHSRGIKVLMDLVVNHTSDEHPWFQESRKDRTNPYRDYYIWRDGTGPGKKNPPNNWRACFGGSAWEYEEATGQFYLHLFSRKQPDLNWDNPKVREEVAAICNDWLEKGVDGFRCDVITYISKPEDLYHASQDDVVVGPHWKQYMQELSERSFNQFDTMIVGEAAGIDFGRACEITREGASRGGREEPRGFFAVSKGHAFYLSGAGAWHDQLPVYERGLPRYSVRQSIGGSPPKALWQNCRAFHGNLFAAVCAR